MRRCWSAWSAASPWPWSSSPGGPLGGEAAANDETFRRLRGAVAQLHASGITHNDLHPANVIVDGERVVLIDFASALRFRAGGLAARWLLPVLARVDLRAVEKWRARLEPGMALQQSAVQSADAAPAARGYGNGRGASRPT